MASLPTQSFATIVQNTIAGIQGRSSALINFSIGSVLRAIVEGFAGLFLWFQSLVLQLLMAMRLSTSQGLDVDTFTADFMPVIGGSQTAVLPGGSPRLGAQASTGMVTFSRFTAGPSSRFIPVGPVGGGLTTNTDTFLKTSDGTQQFVVTPNPANPNYSATLGGYTLASSVASITVSVQDTTPGSAGNVAPGAISVITSALTGIDTVVNIAAFTNGTDQESDGALKSRFAAYILGLSRGDLFGTTAAIEGAEPDIQFKVVENYSLTGAWTPQSYLIIADDGSGNPSPTFLTAVTNAANSVRPLGVQCVVSGPTIIAAIPAMQIVSATGYAHAAVVAAVAAAVASGISSLGLGVDLPYTQVAAMAYAVPGVLKVTALTLNSLSGDAASISASLTTLDGLSKVPKYTIKCTTVIVS
jgi:Baseplate J-like protein